jgi:5-methylcytosine-specific restriction enzyme subunit McrC
MPTPLVLDELQTDSVPVELDDETVASLSLTGLVSVLPAHGGLWKILPCGRVGAVQVGDLLVEVKPKTKVGLDRLLFLLGYARDPGFRPDDVAGLEDTDLFSALAESLARQVMRALRRGVHSGYVTVDDALRTVRGRIRVGDQMSRRPGMLIPLEVTYDDFTVDIPENRILRSALRLMMQVPRLAEGTYAKLAHLDSQLDGVSPVRLGSPLPMWAASRLNDHYVPALRLAETILRNMSAEAGLGRHLVASFVVNMSTVFEDFVATALTEALAKHPGQTIAQYPAYLDADVSLPKSQRVRMYVDVVHEIHGRPALIFDAKYKASSGAGAYPNADYYQMLAYCTALDLPRAWLVYAGPGQPRVRRVINTSVAIVEYSIDVSQDPEALLESIGRLSDSAMAESKDLLDG